MAEEQELGLEELLFQIDSATSDDLSQPREPEKSFDPFSEKEEVNVNNENSESDGTITIEEDGEESVEDTTEEETEETSTVETTSTEEDNDEKQNEEEDKKPSIYSNQFNFLKEEGILDLPEDFEFEDSEEGIQKAFNATKQKVKEEAIKQLWGEMPEQFKQAVVYAAQGGKDFQEFYRLQNKKFSLEDFNLKKEEDQKQVLRLYFQNTTKYSDDRIERMISKLEKLDSLEEEAIDAKDELKVYYDQLADQKAKEEQTRQTAYLDGVTQAVDTLKMDKRRRSKVRAFLVNPVTKSGETSTEFDRTLSSVLDNYEHRAQLANILMDYNSKKGFNLEKMNNTGNAAVKKFKEKLEAITDVKSKVTTVSSKPKVTDTNFN